ncbi:nucleoside monophosphate kinase [Candidatus Uhrbacteria bacterium]|nr:nucleoside monophosphate kinase [Candidatus Uhrbacteria bacterium]
MSRKKLRIVLFGPQGSGKGTQGQMLAERFNIPLIGAGDLFRKEIVDGTRLGFMVKEYVDHGSLAPDELVNAVITNRLKKIDLSKGFILDGYPRNVEQAQHLERLLKINLALYLRMSDTEAMRRLLGRRQCGQCRANFHVTDIPSPKGDECSMCDAPLIRREDDEEETIVRRLATFHFITEPLVSFYRQKGTLLTIQAEQTASEVFHDIVKKMAKLGFS